MPSIVPVAALAALIASLAASSAARAEVPPQRQAAVLGRVLAYDRSMKERAGDSVVVAVLYRSGNGPSEECSQHMFDGFRTIERFVLHGLPFKTTRIAYDASGDWRQTLRSAGVDALYVCLGLDDDIDTIAAAARQRKITTMGAREDFVTRALALGVFESDSKPVIVLNYAASKEEGAVFGNDLLGVAKVINGPN